MSDLPSSYTVKFVPPEYQPDALNDNIDVEVVFDDHFYSATFFTVENVKQVMAKYRSTGECAEGLYFYTANLIIVTELTWASATVTVAHLMESGEFFSAFGGPYPLSG